MVYTLDFCRIKNVTIYFYRIRINTSKWKFFNKIFTVPYLRLIYTIGLQAPQNRVSETNKVAKLVSRWSQQVRSNFRRPNMTLSTKVPLQLSPYMPWRYTGGVEVQLHSFLTSTLDRDEWNILGSGRFNSR